MRVEMTYRRTIQVKKKNIKKGRGEKGGKLNYKNVTLIIYLINAGLPTWR